MFTGLIEEIGTLKAISSRGNYQVLTIDADIADATMAVGDSVACQGACLTVVKVSPGTFVVEASQETVERTVLSSYRAGYRFDLERALKVGDRLGGHFVTGHIDCVGKVSSLRTIGDSLCLSVSFDQSYDYLVVDKGSIAINGVSLTINQTKPGGCEVNIIPHTAKATTLGDLKKNDSVNLEFDMIGKYVAKFRDSNKSRPITKQFLHESGW